MRIMMISLLFFAASCGDSKKTKNRIVSLPLSLLQTQEMQERTLIHFAINDPSLKDELVGFDAGMFRYVLKFELQKHGAGKIRGLYLGPLVDGSIDPIAFDSSREEVELVSYTGFTGPLGKITSLRLTFEFDKKIFDISMLPHDVVLQMLQ